MSQSLHRRLLFRAVLLSSLLPAVAFSLSRPQKKANPAPQESTDESNGAIAITVTDPSGTPLPSAQISLKSAAGAVLKGTTDSTGQIKIVGVKPGLYNVSAQQPGFKTVEQRVIVTPDETANVKLPLQIAPPGGPVTISPGPPPQSGTQHSAEPASAEHTPPKPDHAAVAAMPPPKEAKQELLDVENRWLHAEQDPDAQEEILAPDFLHVLPTGIITKEEQIAYLRQHPAQEPPPLKHFEDLHVRLYGTVGIVNGTVVRGEPGATTKTLFTDVFVYRDGKWKAISAQELHADTTKPTQ